MVEKSDTLPSSAVTQCPAVKTTVGATSFPPQNWSSKSVLLVVAVEERDRRRILPGATAVPPTIEIEARGGAAPADADRAHGIDGHLRRGGGNTAHEQGESEGQEGAAHQESLGQPARFTLEIDCQGRAGASTFGVVSTKPQRSPSSSR